jgi:Transcription termination factor
MIEAVAFVMEHFKTTKKNAHVALRAASEVEAKRAQLDALIGPHLKEYALERIGKVERAILDVALYELLFEKSIEIAVAISEAGRLTKKYSHPSAVEFVVAVINEVYAQCLNGDDH